MATTIAPRRRRQELRVRSRPAFNPAKLEDFLGAIVQVYGPKMLRYKGVLNMKGSERKVIFQGVHQLMGSDLGPGLGEEKGSKMVFIGIDLPKDVLLQGLEQCLNDKQMAFFRLKLSVLKQDILASAGETTEHLREDTVIVPDPADRATIEEEHALELRTRDRERKLLKKIEQSIARIDAGDYGYCDETGEPIGVGRLLARPTATLSLEAQQRRELKQKMFGD
jgi:DnaK suppressor protein